MQKVKHEDMAISAVNRTTSHSQKWTSGTHAVGETVTVAVAVVKKLMGAMMLDLVLKDSVVHGRRWSSQSDQRCKTRRFFDV